MPILLLSMMGLLGLAVLFDGGDDAVDSDEAPDEMQPVEEDLPVDEPPSEALRIEGNAIVDEPPSEALRIEGNAIIATQGDDIITDDILVEVEGFEELFHDDAVLNLLDGDDSYVGSLPNNPPVKTVNGGEGADTLYPNFPGSGSNSTNGDGGDDFLYGGLGNVLSGGEGNDTIFFDSDLGSPEVPGAISGGTGDDTLNILHILGTDNTFDIGATAVSGGAGADNFTLELVDRVVPGMNANGFLETLTFDRVQAMIEDFAPEEDTLTIDISSFTDDGDYELTDVGIYEFSRPTPDGEEDNWYHLILSLLKEGQTEPFNAGIELRSTGGEVTLDDITILTGEAA